MESHLERREKQGKALAELRRLLSHGESSRAQLDKLLVSVIDTLGSGRRRPVVKTATINTTSTTRETKSTEYLLRFLRYLVEVGSQIRSAGLDSPDIVSVCGSSATIISLFHVSIISLKSQEYHSYRSKSNARMHTRL